MTLGKATNPPTTGTVQTITGLLPTGHRGRHGAAAASAAKPVVLGSGKTTVPAGKSAPIVVSPDRGGAPGARPRRHPEGDREDRRQWSYGGTKTSTQSVRLAPPATKRAR